MTNAEKLFNQYYYVPTYVFNKHFFSRYKNDKDDLIQEGLIALWKASESYNSALGVPEILYFTISAYREMLHYIQREYKHITTLSVEDLQKSNADVHFSFDVSDRLACSSLTTVSDTLHIYLDDLYDTLTDKERKWLYYRACGYRGNELAELLKCSRQRCSELCKQVKTKYDKLAVVF